PTTPTSGPCSQTCEPSRGWTPTRWARTPRPATPSGSSPTGSGAPRRAGAHEPVLAALRRNRRRVSPQGGQHMNNAVDELIARSNRLGADPRNTNYAGGNTSAKGTAVVPVTSQPVELVWVKGSGGDLGT